MSRSFTHFIGAQLCITIHTADYVENMIDIGIMTIIVILVGIIDIIDMSLIITITGVAGKFNCGATAQKSVATI